MPYVEVRSAKTRTSARSEAARTISQPCCWLIACSPPSLGALAREEDGLTVSKPMFFGPEQQCARQVHLTSGQEDLLRQSTGIVQVRQNEAVAPYIHEAEGQRLADARAGCPEDAKEQAIALGTRRIDDGQDLVG